MSKVNISKEVLDVLSKSTITENSVVLPDGLDRKLYLSVNKIIELAGGKWNRSAKSHVFKEDPRDKLGMSIKEEVIVDKKKERQAFYTPKKIAERVVGGIDLDGKSVLEPSAGCGNLADACAAKGADVVCIEIDESEYSSLVNRYYSFCHDFLKIAPETFQKFDYVIMNPPFTKGQYLKHIQHALKFLQPEGSLLAIVPNNNCPKLEALGAYTVEVYNNKEFKESGTLVSTRLIEINL